jgi:hypothetical protein
VYSFRYDLTSTGPRPARGLSHAVMAGRVPAIHDLLPTQTTPEEALGNLDSRPPVGVGNDIRG